MDVLFCRQRVLAQFQDAGHEVTVVDKKYLFNILPAMRIMKGSTGWYSAIYTDLRQIHQPVYSEIESLIEKWAVSHPSSEFLVLGCAGCAVPRFINLNFPDGYVTGVELSETMLKVAYKFFLDGLDRRRVSIINEDAFDFVDRCNKIYDVCFVDLFDNSQIVHRIYDVSFLESLSNVMSEESIVMVNFFGQTLEQGEDYCSSARRFFDAAFLVPVAYGHCPVFVKGSSSF